jgi:hypothetical protein
LRVKKAGVTRSGQEEVEVQIRSYGTSGHLSAVLLVSSKAVQVIPPLGRHRSTTVNTTRPGAGVVCSLPWRCPKSIRLRYPARW